MTTQRIALSYTQYRDSESNHIFCCVFVFLLYVLLTIRAIIQSLPRTFSCFSTVPIEGSLGSTKIIFKHNQIQGDP